MRLCERDIRGKEARERESLPCMRNAEPGLIETLNDGLLVGAFRRSREKSVEGR